MEMYPTKYPTFSYSQPMSMPYSAPICSQNFIEKNSRISQYSQNGDRFIPSRMAFEKNTPAGILDSSPAELSLSDTDSESSYRSKCSACAYKALLHENYHIGTSSNSKVLNFSQQTASSQRKSNTINSEDQLCSSISAAYSKAKETLDEYKKSKRRIPRKPDRILDAPEIVDDYYLNLLDWSLSNRLAVCLGHSLYIWNATSGASIPLLSHCMEQRWNVLTAISWSPNDNLIAVGAADQSIKIWDSESQKCCITLPNDIHEGRISALAWNLRNGNVLASAGRDSYILLHDIRTAKKPICKMHGHSQEVCGLKWSPEGMQLASGGNDNCLCLWDIGSTMPRISRPNYHQAAVKALAWCPWQSHLLATGGGTADKCIKTWDTVTGDCLHSHQTDSQICAMMFNPLEKELISAHGFTSNHIAVWRYPSMETVAELKGHKSRVLYMAMSPDASTIVSASADETLRFWKINNQTKSSPSKQKSKETNSCLNEAMLR